MNKLLFSIIGLLILGIIGVSTTSIFSRHEPTTPSGQVALPIRQDDIASTSTSPIGTQLPPAGLGVFSLAQIAIHNSAASCYTAINGSVYDLTAWISQHPGGSQAILNLCGTDGTAAFNTQHGGQRRPANELAGFKIGELTL